MLDKPKVVVTWDLDDVIVDGTVYWLINHYKKFYGFDVDPANFYGDPNDWGVESWEESNARMQPIFDQYGHQLTVPSPEAIDTIHDLARYEHINIEQHIVTGRSEDSMSIHTQKLVDEYFDKDCFKGVHHTNMYHGNRISKGEVCRKIGALVHIDDHIPHCESVMDEGTPNAIVYGDLPWNQNENLRKGMTRCLNMLITTEEILRIAHSKVQN